MTNEKAMPAPLAATEATAQAMTAAPVLMPALVPEPFDYLVPEGTAAGTLVEATLAGRKLVGAVWGTTSPSPLAGLEQDKSRDTSRFIQSKGRGEGVSDLDAAPSTPTPPLLTSPARGEGLTVRAGENAAKPKKSFTLKPVSQVLTHIPPFTQPYRDWLNWVSEFTLAPKGAVLSLCGLAHAAKQPKRPQPPAHYAPSMPTLSDGQESVWQQMQEALVPAAPPVLLDGVTGSGKTEVYFHAIAAAIAAQKQVLVLLPEIVLTHQWLARFEKCFGGAPVAWHSRMTPAAKARAWQAVARGEPLVVVGARSALFLPFANLGLIIVDEEHDPSYKQEDGVLYHARDMAVVRARFEQVPILLVSATPSLETLQNVRDGKYRVLHLASRYGSAGLPEVQLVDLRNDVPERGDFLSPTVKRALVETVARGEQVLLFLNRRGYAPLLLCRSCGHRFECSNCSAWMVVHRKKSSGKTNSLTTDHRTLNSHLQCHHCDHREPMPTACPKCAAEQELLVPCGPGVERIAEEVRAMFGIVPPPVGGRLGGGHHVDSGQGHITAPPQPSPYGGGSIAAKSLPIAATLEFARDLRKEMTDAEKKLWQLLRHESIGVKFRKQHPVGAYIVDFACLSPKLIVELDGGQHAEDSAVKKDAARTAFLEAQGFTVLRFWNHEMLQQSEAVLDKITTTVMGLQRPHPNPWTREIEGHPSISRAPSPRGEGIPTLAVLSSDEAVEAETWEAIQQGRIDILVGTQMVAKGHDFPRLTCVAVVDADVGLSGADLRAGERTYQLLHQLSGRAGRAALVGRVLVQTYLPEHPVMQALVAHNRDQLMALEAQERKAGGWPPYGQLAAILLDGVDEAKVKRAAQLLAQSAPDDARFRVLGPAPAPLSKLRGQYRYRLLVKVKPGIHLQRTLKGWLTGQKFSGVRVKVDVNPYYFL